jgi:predicted PolB exonuclease-like 3'-5' exonuclease
MIVRALDIETIPDTLTFPPDPPKWELVPGMAFNQWQMKEEFPPPHRHRVVAIAVFRLEYTPSMGYNVDGLWSSCRWAPSALGEELDATERDLLSQFSAHMTSHQPSDLFVTWNGRTFDLPVLSLRSMKYGISAPWYYKDRNVRYRFSDEGHLDLMDFFSDYGACRPMKLDHACRLVGLPGKLDIHGDGVFAAYQQSVAYPEDHEALQEKIRRYCAQDAIQTGILQLACRAHQGRMKMDDYLEIKRGILQHSIVSELIPTP